MSTSTSILELTVLHDQILPSKASFSRLSNASTRFVVPAQLEQQPVEETPLVVTEQLQKWNQPRINFYRLLGACFGFIILGANDAAVGALIPYLEKYYHLSYTVVSLVFLSPLFGYVSSALLNDVVHVKFGQRGVALICASCHIVAYTVAALHPPYPLLVIVFVLAGFGNGLQDAAWNAWAGVLANTNEVLGVLHASFGLGATISPTIATTLITKAHLPWYSFYYIMIGFAVLELVYLGTVFWDCTGEMFREHHHRSNDVRGSLFKEAMFTWPAARTTWLCTAFLFVYMGVEVALGGWIVTFMITVRHGSPFASGMTATGFFLGVTIGRVVLGFITPRIGERRAVMIYIPVLMGLELLFWLVPQFFVSAIAVGLQGFFIGPLFPAAILVATRILPRHLHVFAIGFAAAAGGAGASAFPFAVGAIASSSSKGVQILQPIILALLSTLLVIWLAMPRLTKKED